MFSDQLIDQLSQFIIRPHREIYGLDKLGPKKIILKSHSLGCYIEAHRQQSTILSENKKIQLSIFHPHFKHCSNGPTSSPIEEHQQLCRSWKKNTQVFTAEGSSEVTIFLHTNSGSRLEGLEYSKYLLQHGHIVCLFDYSGSGVSEGQYITMGLNEARDLSNVVRYLQDKFGVQKVNLWGRSMGAVTAVLYSARYPRNVRKIVLDSPFCSFRQLVKEIVNSRTGLPEFLFGAILTKIEENLKKKLNLNLMDIDLKQQIIKPGMEKIPIFFLISKQDKLVLPSHVQTLYQLHKGEKKIVYLEGSHNKPRPTQIRQQCADFLCHKITAVSSQKSIDGSKRQYLSIMSRKYSEQIGPYQKRQKPISSSMIVDPSQIGKTFGQQYEKPSNNIYSPTIIKQPLFLNLSKKNKNEIVQTSAQSTPRDQHSTNKSSGIKISLSQLKKSQAEAYIEQQQNRSSMPISTNSGSYMFINSPVLSGGSVGGQQSGHMGLNCNNSSNNMGNGQKGHVYFKKHSRAMAIQYKNKIKQQISKT